MELPQSPTPTVSASPRKRIESIDAFRGFTIAAMIFVIQVAGYAYLPLTFSHFGSAPVSTFKHAGEDAEEREWGFYEAGGITPRTGKTDDYKRVEYPPAKNYHEAQVFATGPDFRTYTIALPPGAITAETTQTFPNAYVWAAKQLQPGDSVIAVRQPGTEDGWRFQNIGIGCTFTDLVAPFFVFIVGVCIPLSRQSRGKHWWRHAGARTLLLILAGMLYISLVLKLSYWWGILQAIGIAYFMGAMFMQVPVPVRWLAIAAIAAFHQWATIYWPWWVTLGDKSKPFLTIVHLREWLEGRPIQADALRPLTIHCTPWASIGYGLCTIIGTLVGEALATREHRKVVRTCLVTGFVFAGAGYALHRLSFPMHKDYVSSSYALFSAGVGALTYLLFYWVMDVQDIKRWGWFLGVFGSNALLAYFMQPVVRIVSTALGTQVFFTNRAGWDGILWGLIWTAVLWVVVLMFNRRNIYWKL